MMRAEVEGGVGFFTVMIGCEKKVDRKSLWNFEKCLIEILMKRYENHWHPEDPSKGEAYRSIHINETGPLEESLQKACDASGISYSDIFLSRDFTMWIDPGRISFRWFDNDVLGFDINGGGTPSVTTAPRKTKQNIIGFIFQEKGFYVISSRSMDLWIPYKDNMSWIVPYFHFLQQPYYHYPPLQLPIPHYPYWVNHHTGRANRRRRR